MKTQSEIVAYLESTRAGDFLSTYILDLLSALDFEHAKPYLNDEAIATGPADWEIVYTTDAVLLGHMHEYLPFAYGKAYGRRGISANRSIDHFIAWSFLVDDTLHAWLTQEYAANYTNYGLFLLRHVDAWLQERGFPAADPHPEATGIPDEPDW